MNVTVQSIREASKRHSRLTDARLAVKRAQRYIDRFPQATATPIVTDIRLALQALIDEVEQT